MRNLEVAVSDGPGTLVIHSVVSFTHKNSLLEVLSEALTFKAKTRLEYIFQTLTEQEAQAFYAMHGDSWVAV